MVNVATVSQELQSVFREWTEVATQVLARLEEDSSYYRKYKKTMTDGVFLAAAGRCGVLVLQALWNRKSQMKQKGYMTPGVIDVSLIPPLLDTVHEEVKRRPSYTEFVQALRSGEYGTLKGEFRIRRLDTCRPKRRIWGRLAPSPGPL